MDILLFLLWCAAIAIALPTAFYGIEIAMSSSPKRTGQSAAARPPATIIVPAHNEEAGIRETVSGIISQMLPLDRLIVIADNCTDATAEIARLAGAEVVERHNPDLRGKGYALDAGLRAIEHNPPPFVVFIDADCSLKPDALDALVLASSDRNGAVQGVNLMIAPPGADIKIRIAELAFLIKNQVRPMGLARMGLGCHLTGTAMALPWPLIQTATVANDNLVEDMKLGLDLAALGHMPTFCEASEVYSYFPHSKAGTETQRRRWESGHLALIKTALRTVFTRQILNHPKSIFFALDLLIPPLSLLLMVLTAASVTMFALTFSLGLPTGPLTLTALALAWFLAMTIVAWTRYGLKALPLRSALQIFPYVVGKIPIYIATFRGKKEPLWIRTDRSKEQNGV